MKRAFDVKWKLFSFFLKSFQLPKIVVDLRVRLLIEFIDMNININMNSFLKCSIVIESY